MVKLPKFPVDASSYKIKEVIFELNDSEKKKRKPVFTFPTNLLTFFIKCTLI